MKLFKVSFKDCYGDDVFVLTNGYDEAAEKALEIKTHEEEEKPIINENDDGSLRKEKTFKVKSVELLTDKLYK